MLVFVQLRFLTSDDTFQDVHSLLRLVEILFGLSQNLVQTGLLIFQGSGLSSYFDVFGFFNKVIQIVSHLLELVFADGQGLLSLS